MTFWNLIQIYLQYRKTDMTARRAVRELECLPRQTRRDIGLPDGGFLEITRRLSGYDEQRKRLEEAMKAITFRGTDALKGWSSEPRCCPA
jgi:hypothetical protein